MKKIVDVRGKIWFVKRTKCCHYQASTDGKRFVRCKIASIATVLGLSRLHTQFLILGDTK